MAKARVVKSEQVPKLDTAARRILLEIVTELPLYTEYKEKGRRLFSKERLAEIEQSYTDGLSWKEIDLVISQEGLSLTQATFRKYLQDGLIPKAVSYNSTDKGRVAIYSADIISHINLVIFLFSVPSNNFIHSIINFMHQEEISAAEAVESTLDRELYPAIFVDLYQGNGQIPCALSEALAKHPEVKVKAQRLFNEISEIFEQHLDPKVVELVEYLKNYPMLLSDLPENE